MVPIVGGAHRAWRGAPGLWAYHVGMAEAGPPRDLVRAIAQRVQDIASLAERIGSAFSAQSHLHPTDVRALMAIYQADVRGAPLTASGLARILDVSPGTVTYAVDRLAASGHVWRDSDPHDARRVVLRFAPHGQEVARGFFGPLGSVHREALAGYTPDELELVSRALGDITDALASFDAGLRDSEAS